MKPKDCLEISPGAKELAPRAKLRVLKQEIFLEISPGAKESGAWGEIAETV
ncbi:hypothetical protein A2U01_0013232 [Trifolium medium]|uniref:Uncharacterized protein n=1 Tax=Trifolium medium TaxID=97028 RepID=A0A392MZB1_9FABA|nr:hypothetical protein [Trifolium medium]